MALEPACDVGTGVPEQLAVPVQETRERHAFVGSREHVVERRPIAGDLGFVAIAWLDLGEDHLLRSLAGGAHALHVVRGDGRLDAGSRGERLGESGGVTGEPVDATLREVNGP